MTGVVPHSLYRRLTTDLTASGCRVLVDLAGERLSAALEGGPFFVKVSHDELIEDGLARSDRLPDLIAAARRIAEHGPRVVVVSRSAESALALVEDKLFTVHVPTGSGQTTRALMERVELRAVPDKVTGRVDDGTD